MTSKNKSIHVSFVEKNSIKTQFLKIHMDTFAKSIKASCSITQSDIHSKKCKKDTNNKSRISRLSLETWEISICTWVKIYQLLIFEHANIMLTLNVWIFIKSSKFSSTDIKLCLVNQMSVLIISHVHFANSIQIQFCLVFWMKNKLW